MAMNRRPAERTTVALYSGGVDSYCMAYLTRPDVLLYVRMGGRYGEDEYAFLHTPLGMADNLTVISAHTLGRLELPDSKVIPGRNAVLAILASNFGDDILMGSVDSSTGHDKDNGFAARMNELFDWMYQPSRWLLDGRNVRLRLPFYHLTKTELVGQVLARGHSPDTLAGMTFSCYEPTREQGPGVEWVQPCGKCPPCGRKWMAFTVYGIDVGYDGREAIQPYINELEVWGNDRSPHRSKKFCEEVVDARDGVVRPIPAAIPIDRLGRDYSMVDLRLVDEPGRAARGPH